MTNVLDDEVLTPDNQAEEPEQPTDSQEEGETSTDSAEAKAIAKDEKGIEPPAGTKSWEHALQMSREREKKERALREQLEQKLQETTSRLDALELEGLDETERYRLEAERAKQEAQELKEKIQTEEAKKEYRRVLAEKEAEYPKTISFLKKQADKDIYPVQGRTLEEFETNLAEFAADLEESTSSKPAKAVASNPAYVPPEEPDLGTLSSKELRKILPIAR